MSQQAIYQEQVARMRTYYRFQSRIYDLSRWAFLFGRESLIHKLPFDLQQTFTGLEIGCGTGYNLRYLSYCFPKARLTGLDVSDDMLRIAARQTRTFPQIQLRAQAYGSGVYGWTGKLDLILFSYALTMINPQWEELIGQAWQDLRPGGIIAVVDFHDSRLPAFKTHMQGHHVRMDAHLLPALHARFIPQHTAIHKAYFGMWQYMLFVGKKPAQATHLHTT
jgi:S-adenosylmethionine-diacylgycerolhomoserine-N-methlytransferase